MAATEPKDKESGLQDTSLLRQLRTLHVDVERINRRTCAHEKAVALLAPEAEVCAGLRQVDLTNQITIWCVTTHTVLALICPAHATPHVALDIDAYPVSNSRRKICGENAAAMTLAIFYCKDPDMCRAAMGSTAVNHIDQLLIR